MTLATALRSGLTSLVELATADLGEVWHQLAPYLQEAADGDPNAQAMIAAALHDVLPGLIGSYQDAAITVASDQYDIERDRMGIDGTFRALGIDIDDGGHALAGYVSATAQTVQGYLGLTSGGMSKRIMQAGNQTIMAASIDDPRADGWQRQTRSGSCDFCQMLAGRGDVYTRATADFASHDHCHCVATVAFTGEERPVKPFTPSSRGRSIVPPKPKRASGAGGGGGGKVPPVARGGGDEPEDFGPDIPFTRADLPPHSEDTYAHAIETHAKGRGVPNKTEFPWSDPVKIVAAIADVVDRNQPTMRGNILVFEAEHRGYAIRVEYETYGGQLSFYTAFPPPQAGPRGGKSIRKNPRR